MKKTQSGIVIFLIALSAFVMIGVLLGAVGSFYTGQAQEFPKYNGKEYLLFCAKLGGYGALMFGLLPSILIAVVKKRKGIRTE